MTPQYEPTFFLLKRRIPASESANLLGRIVRRYQDPTISYTPESPSQSLTPDGFGAFLLDTQYDTDAIIEVHGTRHDKFRAALSGLLSLSTGSTEGDSATVRSPAITTRRLKQERDYFETVKAIPEVRRKILDMCPVGDKVYLIVGTMSVQGAEFTRTSVRSKCKGGSVSGALPLAVAAGSVAALPMSPDVVPAPEVEARTTDSSRRTMTFSSLSDKEDGEVFAIACKEITRNWRGLGGDVRLKTRHPEYRGGQHFGAGEDADDSDGNEEEEGCADETSEALAAEGLELSLNSPVMAAAGLWISHPYPESSN